MAKRLPLLAGLLVVLLIATSGRGARATAEGIGTTIVTGLNTPTGVLAHPDGSIWVAESGVPGTRAAKSRNFENGDPNATALLGDSGRVLRVAPNGYRIVEAALPTIKIGSALYGPHHLALLNGAVYVATTAWADYVQTSRPPFAGTVVKMEHNKQSQVADLFTFENTYNPDGFQKESDPYGIAAGPDGNLYVAEAGANTLLKVNPATGTVNLVAVFSGMFSPIPNANRNGQMTTDPVPTGVDVDREGNIYVGFFGGMPFLPGATKIVKVTPEGKVTNYATNLSTITAVRFGPDGNLYALSFGEFTPQGYSEKGGMLLRIKPGVSSEVLVSGIPTPSALDFDKAGNAYVTTSGWAPGEGKVIKYPEVTKRNAERLLSVDSTDNSVDRQTSFEVDGGQDTAAPIAELEPVAATWQWNSWPIVLAIITMLCLVLGWQVIRARRGSRQIQ